MASRRDYHREYYHRVRKKKLNISPSISTSSTPRNSSVSTPRNSTISSENVSTLSTIDWESYIKSSKTTGNSIVSYLPALIPVIGAAVKLYCNS